MRFFTYHLLVIPALSLSLTNHPPIVIVVSIQPYRAATLLPSLGPQAHRQGEDYKKLQKCAAAEKLFTKFQIDLYEELKPSKSNL